MKRYVLKLILFFMIFLLFINPITGCWDRNEKHETKRLRIVTTLFPLYDFTKYIVGDKGEVTLILPPGVEPHGFEPKAGDILKINSADIFIYTGKFMEPWAEKIVKGVEDKKLLIINTSTGIEALHLNNIKTNYKDKHHLKHNHSNDPHVWLDPINVIAMVDSILTGLIKKDPINREYYENNAKKYKEMVAELDKKFKKTLSLCKKRIIVHGGHFAFGYMAKRYGLEYLSAYKGAPDAEPTPKLVAHLKKIIKEGNLKYIFYEELITPRVAKVLAEETKTELLKLHTCGNISKEEMDRGVTFLSLMEENLKNLKTGLECP